MRSVSRERRARTMDRLALLLLLALSATVGVLPILAFK
jgi:hypothetical protein